MYQKPAKKSLGQHFLQDLYYLNQLLHVISPNEKDFFLEIGPGCGYLTSILVGKVEHLIAVEVDGDCVSFLEEKFQSHKEVEIVQADVLQLDFQSMLGQSEQAIRWVGNLPYNISVPILLRLIDVSGLVKDASFLVQKEVSRRASAGVGQKHYGRLGIVLQCVFEVSSVLEIPPSAFDPPPKVDSEVILLKPLKDPCLHYLQHPKFSDTLIRCFSKRRKMLRKIFQGIIDDDGWASIGIDSSLRPEMVSAEGFYRIACLLED